MINVIIIDARVEPVSNTQEYNKQQCFFTKIMLAKHLKTLDAVTAYNNPGCYDKKKHSQRACLSLLFLNLDHNERTFTSIDPSFRKVVEDCGHRRKRRRKRPFSWILIIYETGFKITFT